MDDILGRLAFCTFSTGATMVREVLGDWEMFLGGRPAEVVFVVGARDGVVPPVYEELLAEGRIDRLIRLESAGRSPESLNAEAMYQAIQAATTEWVASVKLDMLPYRVGHDGWLTEAMRRVEQGGYVGITSTAPFRRDLRVVDGYRLYQGYSENFAMTRRADWLAAVAAIVGPGGDYHSAAVRGDPRFQGDDHRLLNEGALTSWMAAQGKWMLMRVESRDWSIFHVNVWGDRLRHVRDDYQARRGIDKYLNCMYPPGRDFLYPWELFYGTKPPPPLRRLKIAVGRWRRQLLARN